MLFDHEYREWEAQVEEWKLKVAEIDAANKTARAAELAAGRPPSGNSSSPSESPADAINSNLANY